MQGKVRKGDKRKASLRESAALEGMGLKMEARV